MSEETIIKADKDYTDLLNQELPEVDTLSDSGNSSAAFEKLFSLEKKTRQASDLASSKRVLAKIVQVAKKAGNWKLLNEQIVLLSKKHGQLKQAITSLVQDAIAILDDAPDLDTKITLIETIRTVTEGKIFVEVERARVSRMLSKIKEKQGDIDGATEVLGELQVETFGSMDIREKMEFILEQVDLYVRKGDFVQAQIVSRKITPRHLEKEDFYDLKLKFYDLNIKIALHDNKYLDACQDYRHIYDTPQIIADETKWKPVLENIVYFIILSPYDNLASDLIHKIAKDTKLESLPVHQELIRCFTVDELMRWPKVEEIYGPALAKTSVFDQSTKEGKARWLDMRKRVIEHNIRVVAKFYTRITTARLTALLDLSEKETEEFLSKLVTQGTIYARINRPERIVTFAKPKDANDVLNEWSNNISSLLEHVETIGHLITKDEMVNALVK